MTLRFLLTLGGANLAIDSETERILLRSRQATSRPSPERSPDSSPHGSTTDLFRAADQKLESTFADREVQLQEIEPETFLEFGSEIWRCVHKST